MVQPTARMKLSQKADTNPFFNEDSVTWIDSPLRRALVSFFFCRLLIQTLQEGSQRNSSNDKTKGRTTNCQHWRKIVFAIQPVTSTRHNSH